MQNSETESSQEDFEGGLPGAVQTLRLIHLAMGGSIAMFAGIALYLYFTTAQKAPAPGDETFMRAFSMAVAVFGAGLWIASGFAYGSKLRGPGGFLARVQAAEVVRLAMREGAAFLGLIGCMQGAMNGMLAAQPLYWLNGLPAFAFWVFVVRSLAVEERLRALHAEGADGARLVQTH